MIEYYEPSSDCCGAETTEIEMGICPECLEHCDFTSEPVEEHEPPSAWTWLKWIRFIHNKN